MRRFLIVYRNVRNRIVTIALAPDRDPMPILMVLVKEREIMARIKGEVVPILDEIREIFDQEVPEGPAVPVDKPAAVEGEPVRVVVAPARPRSTRATARPGKRHGRRAQTRARRIIRAAYRKAKEHMTGESLWFIVFCLTASGMNLYVQLLHIR